MNWLKSMFLLLIGSAFVVLPLTSYGQGRDIVMDEDQVQSPPPDSALQDTTIASGLPIGPSAISSQVDYYGDDSVILDMIDRKVRLYQKAYVVYDDMRLEADYIEVDFNTNEIFARGVEDSVGMVNGKPVFTTGGKSFNADEMRYNFKTKQGLSSGVVTKEQGGIIRGTKVLKDSADNMYIRKATYTTCDAEHPHFWISASKFKVIPEKQVVSGPANLVIAGINTPIVLPFGFFPIQQKRSKGLIVGSFDQQARWGYGLRDFGFYSPVNDYLDVLLTGDIYLRGSWGFSVKTNYKKRYRYNGLALFKYNKFFEGDRGTTEFQEVNNYRLEWIYNKDPKASPGSNFSANVKYISKNQQKYASTDVNEIIATNANSSVSYSRGFANKKVFLTTNSRIDQNLNTGDLNIELPEMTVNVQRLQPFKNMSGPKDKYKVLKNIGVTYNSSFRNNIQVNQDSIFNRSGRTIELSQSFLDGVRNGIRHSAGINTSFTVLKYFNLSPNFSLTDFWYFKTIDKSWENDTLITRDVSGFSRAASYSGGINLNTVIFGTKTFSHPRIKAIRHVIRPTVGYRWSPDYMASERSGYRMVQVNDTGLMSAYSIYENGIYRGPAGSAAGAINFALNNNLEMKLFTPNDSTNGGLKKVKIIESLNISGNYNTLADSLKMSDININAFTTLFNKVRVNFSTRLDPYQFVYDSSTSRYKSIDKYALADGSLGQFTSRTLRMSTSLNPDALKRRKNNQDGEFITGQDYFMDFSIPWDLNLNYSSQYSRRIGETEGTVDQTLMFDGNISLTKYWKIGFRSGYNFTTGEPSITSIDFARDLHCWVFNFHWIPVGQFRQFNFELKVKAAMLKDLKIRKRDQWMNSF